MAITGVFNAKKGTGLKKVHHCWWRGWWQISNTHDHIKQIHSSCYSQMISPGYVQKSKLASKVTNEDTYKYNVVTTIALRHIANTAEVDVFLWGCSSPYNRLARRNKQMTGVQFKRKYIDTVKKLNFAWLLQKQTSPQSNQADDAESNSLGKTGMSPIILEASWIYWIYIYCNTIPQEVAHWAGGSRCATSCGGIAKLGYDIW